jgi:putative phosphoesterase
MLRVGLISDTHGLLRPEAERFLDGCDHIVHAGDIGAAGVLSRLQAIAPVTAVRGNNDTAEWAATVPETQRLSLGGVVLFLLHDLSELERRGAPAGARVVVCGHSHRASVRRQPSGLLVVNPGSAGPRRFKLPVTAEELTITAAHEVRVRVVPLL